MSFLEKLLRRPQPEDLIWRAACQTMEKVDGRSFMMELALELREQGDDSAIVLEDKGSRPYCSLLTMRWNLKPSESEPYQVSRGVSIAAWHMGKVSVGIMFGPTWHALETVFILSPKSFPQNPNEMSLEEKVRLAMSIADHYGDSRSGKGKGRDWEIIFP